MISSNDLKPGQTINVDGDIYTVLDISQNKTARSAMVVKAKVRNLRTGSNVELSWGGGEKVEPANIEKREMQYLYDTEDSLVFMDNETFEQVEIPSDRLEWEKKFLKANDNVSISSYEGEILGVILPDKAVLKVLFGKVGVISKNFTVVIISELEIGLVKNLVFFDMTEQFEIIVAVMAGCNFFSV